MFQIDFLETLCSVRAERNAGRARQHSWAGPAAVWPATAAGKPQEKVKGTGDREISLRTVFVERFAKYIWNN